MTAAAAADALTAAASFSASAARVAAARACRSVMLVSMSAAATVTSTRVPLTVKPSLSPAANVPVSVSLSTCIGENSMWRSTTARWARVSCA